MLCSPFLTDSELVSCANRFATGEIDLQQLFTMHRSARLIRESCDDLLALDVDYLSGRRISQPSVDAERYPSGLLAQLDAHLLFRRHGRCIENMKTLVETVTEPDFCFIRRQADAVTRAAVPLDLTFLI